MKTYSRVTIFFVVSLLAAGAAVWAQAPPLPLPPAQQQPQGQPAQQQAWTPEQLDNLVAPIALFPDPLISQLLVASTYPLEVVEAYQWLQRNRGLGDKELMDAARQQPWDPSVQALVAVPDALTKLNQDVRWTTELGNAFLAQQGDVMNAIQQMRARAQSNGRLSSTPEQTVSTQSQGGQQAIVIEPANPQVIYVPAYDPTYVWGPPAYGYYPPLYYSSFGFGFGFGPGCNLGFYFGGWGGWGTWGWGPSWYGHSVYTNSVFFSHYGFRHGYGGGGHGGGHDGHTAWAHDSGHRQGVPYGNQRGSNQARGASMSSGNSVRNDFGSRNGASSSSRFSGSSVNPGSRNSARNDFGSRTVTAPSTNGSLARSSNLGTRNSVRNDVGSRSITAPSTNGSSGRSSNLGTRNSLRTGVGSRTSTAPATYGSLERSSNLGTRSSYRTYFGSSTGTAPSTSGFSGRTVNQGSRNSSWPSYRFQAPSQPYRSGSPASSSGFSGSRSSSSGGFNSARSSGGGSRSGGARSNSGGGGRNSGGGSSGHRH